MSKSSEIREAIESLPRDDPQKCEGQIRQLHRKIKAVKGDQEKEELLDELKSVSCYGLSEDLRTKMEQKGLAFEYSFDLVLLYKTTLLELAKHLYLTKDAENRADLAVIRDRMGDEIEVLGALQAKGVDVKNKWVKDLCEEAPSLKSLILLPSGKRGELCKEASEGEKAVVVELINEAQGAKQAELPSELAERAAEEASASKKDEENLKQARKLMDETKRMATAQASSNKKEMNANFKALLQALELSPDCYQVDTVAPEVLMNELNEIIEQKSKVIHSLAVSNKKKYVDLVTEASGGRALCAIYHSEYEPPRPAGQPILLAPTTVKMFEAGHRSQKRYVVHNIHCKIYEAIRANFNFLSIKQISGKK